MRVAGTRRVTPSQRRDELPHGTLYGYHGGGKWRSCRCPACTECWRRYEAQRNIPAIRHEDALSLIEQRPAVEQLRERDRVVVLLGAGKQMVFPRSHPLAESMLRALVEAEILCPSQ